jgi:hypothetical protein
LFGVGSYCRHCLGVWSLERYHIIRCEVLTHYSGGTLACALCAENHYEFLALDHTAGDLVGAGRRDREAIGAGGNLIRRLKRSGYPEGFRVLCHNCNFRVIAKRPWKYPHQESWYARIRSALLRHYSGPNPMCACCACTEVPVLTLDHIHGGGEQHRKVVGRGSAFYRWVQKNGYPPDYQVLCHNCNHAAGQIGYCPHTRA